MYATIFGCEDALVRGQFISGSHALNVCFFALLRPGDLLLSICGKPYDTLDEVIGITENKSSLKSYGVNYEQIDLFVDYEKLNKAKQKEQAERELQRAMIGIKDKYGKDNIIVLVAFASSLSSASNLS